MTNRIKTHKAVAIARAHDSAARERLVLLALLLLPALTLLLISP